MSIADGEIEHVVVAEEGLRLIMSIQNRASLRIYVIIHLVFHAIHNI